MTVTPSPAAQLRSIREGSAMVVVKAAQDAEKAVGFLTASFPAGGTDAASVSSQMDRPVLSYNISSPFRILFFKVL